MTEQGYFFRGSKLILTSPDGSKKMTMTLDNDGALKLADDAGAKHRLLATGLNSQSGEVVFSDTKSMRVDFSKEFSNWPAITLTMLDENNTPPYRIWPGKTGFTVRFKNKFTGSVSWVAMEA